MATLAAAEPARPAGGAPLWQLLVLTVIYVGGTGGVLWLVSAHRRGRTRILRLAGDVAGWVFRLPGWAALPVALAAVGLLLAMWSGLYDIGYHVDNGRDEGPLGNPGHLPLLLGLFLTFAGGLICLGLADQKDRSPAWIRLAPGWHVPLGGVLLTACMAFGSVAIALDDVWHRIFGQDVTLWSPTHFVFLCGGILTVIGMLVLLKEGAIARGSAKREEFAIEPIWRRIQRVALLGGLLCGFELFLAEYDWGVPLYRQVWQPFLLAAMSGLVFTAARAWAGPGSAIGAWAVYLLIRISGILLPLVAGVSASSMPLFLAAAVSVELLALRVDPRRSQLAFGALAGLLCGTVGFAGEYGWSQLVMPLPWTSALLPEGLICAVLGGIGGGLLGALLAASLRGTLPSRRIARAACIGAFALLIGVAVNAGTKHVPAVTAQFQLTDVKPPPEREAQVTVRLTPRDAAQDPNWLYILAWQGSGDDRVVDRLRQVGPGIYRSTKPIPLHGTWKAGLRLNRGYERGAVPMRLPVDNDLPNASQRIPEVATAAQLKRAMRRSAGAELPAPASFTRPFGDDNLIVLRETKGDVAGWLWTLGLGLTALLWGSFAIVLVLGVARIARRGGARKLVPA